MWYEILPSAGIIFAVMAIPHFIAYPINKLVLGNSYRRALHTRDEKFQYMRDRRLGDNPYKVIGLESLPDWTPSK